jgi:hypothetical protein
MRILSNAGLASALLVVVALPAWATRTTPPPTVSPGCGNVTGTATSDQPEDKVIRVELQKFNPVPPPGHWETLDWKDKIRKNVTNDGPGSVSEEHPNTCNCTVDAPGPGRYRTRVTFFDWNDTNGNGKVDAGETTQNGSPVTSGTTTCP